MARRPLSGEDGRLDTLLEAMRAFADAGTDSQTLLNTVTECVTRLMGESCAILLSDRLRRSRDPGRWCLAEPLDLARLPIQKTLWNQMPT